MTSPVPARSIWLVGDATRAEFQPAARWLSQVARVTSLRPITTGQGQWHTSPVTTDQGQWHTSQAACVSSLPADFPDWIVLVSGQPGEFSHAEVRRLQAARPLARPIGLLGSWCEGEPRTGQPWPGVARVLWHQWEPRLKRQWRLLTTGQAATWALPRTALLAEELLFDLPPRGEFPAPPGSVVIQARPAANAEALAEGCRTAGFQVETIRNPSPQTAAKSAADVAIWDAPGWRRDEWSDLAAFVSRMHPTPVLAVITAPRHDDMLAAQAHGAAAVLGKPFQVHDLWWWLDELRRAPRPLVERAAAWV